MQIIKRLHKRIDVFVLKVYDSLIEKGAVLELRDWLYGFERLLAMTCIVLGVDFFMSDVASNLMGTILLVVGFVSLLVSNTLHSQLSECFSRTSSHLHYLFSIVFWVSYGVVTLYLFRLIRGEAQHSALLLVGSIICIGSGIILLKLCITTTRIFK